MFFVVNVVDDADDNHEREGEEEKGKKAVKR